MKGMARVRVIGKGGIAKTQEPLITNTLGIVTSWLQSSFTAKQAWPNVVLRLQPTLPALPPQGEGLIHHYVHVIKVYSAL